MGWHEQGDGKLFLGINIEQGRVKDYDDNRKIKTALRKIVDDFGLTMILSPSQSIIFKDILPSQKAAIEEILANHNMPLVETIDPLVRNGMACPAFPLCGLAVAEAERRMPEFQTKVRTLLTKLGMEDNMILRVTGCPNGCARYCCCPISFWNILFFFIIVLISIFNNNVQGPTWQSLRWLGMDQICIK